MTTDLTKGTAQDVPPAVACTDAVLHFEIPGLSLCLPLATVSRVILLAALQPVPSAPAFVRGLLNLHGTPIPVIDLAGRLGQPMPKRYCSETPMLLCMDGDRTCALIVERVVGPAPIGAQGIRATQVSSAPGSPFLGAVANADKTSLLLDPSVVLDFNAFVDPTKAPWLGQNPALLDPLSAP